MAATTTPYPLRQRRQQATRRFTLRVVLLLTLIIGIGYIAWFAPWSRHAPPVQIETRP